MLCGIVWKGDALCDMYSEYEIDVLRGQNHTCQGLKACLSCASCFN
jgi:hypothetical protein